MCPPMPPATRRKAIKPTPITELVQQWEICIKRAETQQKQNKSVMDILAATRPQQEEFTLLPEPSAADSLITEWLQMAIVIHEKQ